MFGEPVGILQAFQIRWLIAEIARNDFEPIKLHKLLPAIRSNGLKAENLQES
jgi:hypothetical protein